MYTVYVLRSSDDKLYKGLTNNFERRLQEHKSSGTRTTSRMKGLEVIYKENFDDFGKARKRELYFKSAAGRRFLRKVLDR